MSRFFQATSLIWLWCSAPDKNESPENIKPIMIVWSVTLTDHEKVNKCFMTSQNTNIIHNKCFFDWARDCHRVQNDLWYFFCKEAAVFLYSAASVYVHLSEKNIYLALRHIACPCSVTAFIVIFRFSSCSYNKCQPPLLSQWFHEHMMPHNTIRGRSRNCFHSWLLGEMCLHFLQVLMEEKSMRAWARVE